jgi:hypothetical protein
VFGKGPDSACGLLEGGNQFRRAGVEGGVDLGLRDPQGVELDLVETFGQLEQSPVGLVDDLLDDLADGVDRLLFLRWPRYRKIWIGFQI